MTQGDQTRDSLRRSLRSRIRLWWCVVGGSGGGFEGDSEAQRGELGDVVAHPAFDVDPGDVVVGPRSWKRARGSASRCQTMTRMERATGTRALSLPRRLTMRR